MIARKFIALGVIAMTATGAATVAAIGDGPPTREQASQSASSRYAAFDRGQRPHDVFKASSGNSANQAAGQEIAKTSRRVAATSAGEGFAFLNARNEVCFLWRPARGGVAASECSAAADGNPPGILMGQNGTLSQATVAGLVPKGTERVTITHSDGTTTDVPITDGAYVYEGKSPFTVSWTGPDGKTFSNTVRPIDVRDLEPVS